MQYTPKELKEELGKDPEFVRAYEGVQPELAVIAHCCVSTNDERMTKSDAEWRGRWPGLIVVYEPVSQTGDLSPWSFRMGGDECLAQAVRLC